MSTEIPKLVDAIQITAKGHAVQDVKHPKRTNRTLLLIIGAVLLFIVLALGLGLGLGLGLKKSATNTSKPTTFTATPTSSTATPSATASSQPSWRLDKEAYNLGLDWDLNAAPTTRVYNFTVGTIPAAPDGVVRTMSVINGQFPSPLIRVNRGDRVLLNVTNHLDVPTAMHWHGLLQNGTNWMDGTSGITQCPIPPGGNFLYNFTVENQYGTYWYHSHYKSQYIDGMTGAFIVHAPEEAEARKGYDYVQIVMLQDWYHDTSTDLLPGYLASGNENTEPVPDNGLIQGTNTFDCSLLDTDTNYTCYDNSTQALFDVTQNSRYRLRLINTGAFTEFSFSIDNHTLSVIEADSTPVVPLEVHRLPIHVAQRYSVILNANQAPTTNYYIRATMSTDCFRTHNPVLNPSVVALLSYTNTNSTPTASTDWTDAYPLVCKDLNSTLLAPSTVKPAPRPDVLYSFVTNFQIGSYALDRGFFNSTTWMPANIPTLNQALTGLQNASTAIAFSTSGVSTGFSSNQLVVSIPSVQVVDLLVTNLDDGAHPFHLHGHSFWIMGQSSPPEVTGYFPWDTYGLLNTTNPIRRDTLTVPGYGWALIRFEADNPGLWAFHCHIAWHMEAGLLMQFMERTDLMAGWTLPEDVRALCDG